MIVGAFESRLEEQVLLAFFVPGVVYLADAVGTQTEAVQDLLSIVIYFVAATALVG